MLVQSSNSNSSVASGWSRARCSSKGSSAPSVHCDSGKSDTDGTPRALGRKKRSFKMKYSAHSTRNYLRRQQGETARNVEGDTVAGDGAPAQQCCGSAGSLSSSRHRLLIFLALVTAATWLVFLDRIGQSTFDIVHRGSHTFNTVSRRVTGWDSAEARLRDIENSEVLPPMYQEQHVLLLQDLHVADTGSAADGGPVGGSSRAPPTRRSTRRRTSPPPAPADALEPDSLPARVAEELRVFYTARSLPAKAEQAGTFVLSASRQPRLLLEALVQRYGDSAMPSFPLLAEWIRLSEGGKAAVPAETPLPPPPPLPSAQTVRTAEVRGVDIEVFSDAPPPPSQPPAQSGRGRGRGAGGRESEDTGGGGGQLREQSRVQAANDIKVGNHVIVHEGSPGVVVAVTGDSKYRVRFLGEFGVSKPILLLVNAPDLEVISY
eukprot:Rhum_TRINITY_DN14918_c1_g1::Rhum_TRINITY_DN14918_c1_g1_i1::g.127937::m.127937